ncbi:larval cuticle protein LCP-17-like [Penaeus japonicus]|uniref:larval cuticle protein LCP-17-like n=1 Tax=Penaeus japonicus TaxID=27405 RepID=UPI001C7159E1|nr:larval cuticle protein LCP-17-like [Penaeus japonicus]
MHYISRGVSRLRHHLLNTTALMKTLILACVAAVAIAAPQYAYEAPPLKYAAPSASIHNGYGAATEVVPILKDDRIQEDDGRYSVDVETGNGIKLTESGTPDGPEGSVIKAGQYEYTAPDGTTVQLKYVANENGFQPQSDLLPVAPEFPHPIPQFVLDQIEFAAQEAAAAEAAEAAEAGTIYTAPAPSQLYSHP